MRSCLKSCTNCYSDYCAIATQLSGHQPCQKTQHTLLGWYGQQLFGSCLTPDTWRWLQRPTAGWLMRSRRCLHAEAAARASLEIKPTLKTRAAIAPGHTAKAPAAQPEAKRTGDLPHLSHRQHGAAWRNLLRSHPGGESQPNVTAAAASPQLPLRERRWTRRYHTRHTRRTRHKLLTIPYGV